MLSLDFQEVRMSFSIAIVRGGPHGKNVKAGPIFDENGDLFLVALRNVRKGELNAADAFVYPDFSRPKENEQGTKAAAFWWGWVPFSQ